MAEKTRETEKSPSNLTFDMLRVTPTPPEKDINPKTDRLTDLLIILFILGISVWYRFYFRQIFLDEYSMYVFHLKIKNGDPLGFGSFLGLSPGDTVQTEGYHDFYTYYIPYVNAYSEGWNPYTGSRTRGDTIGGYVYGPFYMVSIALGKLWFGLDTTDSIVYSNILLDSLTYVMVYILAKRYTGNIIAMIMALLGSFSPISLFYIAYRGLNAPIMNLSFLLFVYFFLEKRDNLSMITLAFSLLTKQFPLFMAMPAGLWMVRRYGFFKGVSYYLRGIMAALIFSIPYILWTPRSYIVRLFLPGGAKPVPNCPENSEATNLFHGSIPLGACFNADGTPHALDTSMLPNWYGTLFNLVNTHVLFFGSIIILAWVGFTGYDFLEERPRLYLVFFAAYFGVAHATIARGIYKYYLTFLVPLFILGFVFGNRHKSFHFRLGYLLHRGWRTWFDPKYRQKEATIEFWVFGALLTTATYGTLWLINSAVNMFSFNTHLQLFWSIIFIPLGILTIIKPGPCPESIESEFVEIKQYGINSSIYVILAAIGGFFLMKVANLYFEEQANLNGNLIAIIFISFVVLAIPLAEQQVTKSKTVYSPFTVNYLQIVSDIILFLIIFQVIVYFHTYILTVNRFYTTLSVLLFSFIPMALLGNQVWTSSIKAPSKFIREFFKIRDYVNLRYNPTK